MYLRCQTLFFLTAFALPLLAAQPPGEVKGAKDPKDLKAKVKEIAGSAEFLRSVPKHFATLKAIDAGKRQVTLLVEGEMQPRVWQLVPDAEIKVLGWWGRLDDFQIGDRVWVWLKTDRKKQPVAISMLADEPSEQEIHGGVTLTGVEDGGLSIKNAYGKTQRLKAKAPATSKTGAAIFFQSQGDVARLIMTKEEFEKAREQQKDKLRQRWARDGLPGTVAFVHVFSGEMDLILDHETMRWARSLQVGDAVTLAGQPPIKALVKSVQPWRERTQVRLVVHSLDLADLSAGDRLLLLRKPPALEVDTALLPPDIDRPRTSKQERLDWFLASIYCTCGVRGDRCTGHFYTLASCNPNACGMPNQMRQQLAEKIDQGLTDRQIFEQLLKDHGPELVRPHLLP